MTYEEAMVVVGDMPAWLLKEIVERAPNGSRQGTAAALLLKRKGRGRTCSER